MTQHREPLSAQARSSGRDDTGLDVQDPHAARQRGAEHEPLKMFLGRWNVEGHNTASAPRDSRGEVTGEVSYELLHGGFYVICRWDRQFGNQSQRHVGVGVIGYDPEHREYFSNNVDNLGYERRYRLELSDRTWRFVGPFERAELEFSADGRAFTETWEISEDGSSWQPLCDLKATKLQ
jgi:hypothetical protein